MALCGHGGAGDCEHPFGVALVAQSAAPLRDGIARGIRSIVYDIAGDGSLGAGKIFVTVEDQPGGLKTDEASGVWVASAAGIRHFDRNAKPLETIALLEPAGNCNWGESFPGSLHHCRNVGSIAPVPTSKGNPHLLGLAMPHRTPPCLLPYSPR